jgi:hypothetical protein
MDGCRENECESERERVILLHGWCWFLVGREKEGGVDSRWRRMIPFRQVGLFDWEDRTEMEMVDSE